MMIKKKSLIASESFNDGMMSVLEVDEGVILANKNKAPFGNKTIGISRFYQAKVVGVNIAKVIAVQANVNIDSRDVVELYSYHDGKKAIYRVDLIQDKDTVPPTKYISLVKDGVLYDDRR